MELTPILRHLVDTAFKVAQDCFKEGRDVLPQIVLMAEDEDGMTIIPIISIGDNILGGEQGNRHARDIVQGSWAKVKRERPGLKLQALTIMADIYMKRIPTQEMVRQMAQGTFKRPSKATDSEEVIIVQLTIGKESSLYIWPYVQAETGHVFDGEWRLMEEPSCLFTDLWPQ